MKRSIMLGALFVAVLALGYASQGGASAGTPDPSMEIVGVLYGPQGQVGREWLELRNMDRATQLHGWTLANGRGDVFRLGEHVLGGGAYLRIHTGHGHAGAHDVYMGRNHSMWSNHDTVVLRSPQGTTVQRFHYNGNGSGVAWCHGHANEWGPWGADGHMEGHGHMHA